MLIAALVLRPWVQIVQDMGVRASILVDDIMITAEGGGMAPQFHDALNLYYEDATRQFRDLNENSIERKSSSMSLYESPSDFVEVNDVNMSFAIASPNSGK